MNYTSPVTSSLTTTITEVGSIVVLSAKRLKMQHKIKLQQHMCNSAVNVLLVLLYIYNYLRQC